MVVEVVARPEVAELIAVVVVVAADAHRQDQRCQDRLHNFPGWSRYQV